MSPKCAKLNGKETSSKIELTIQNMDNKDLNGILDLSDYDAVIYEPFSKEKGLEGRSAIEPFLKVEMMANSSLRRVIKIEKPSKPDKVTALITFEKGDKVMGRFTFEFQDNSAGKKIKSLHIDFENACTALQCILAT
jgi:hypothetical protein